MDHKTGDSVVDTVMQRFSERSQLGQSKYGTTLDRTDLSAEDWAQHMQEELMDAILYLERLKRELAGRNAERLSLRAYKPFKNA